MPTNPTIIDETNSLPCGRIVNNCICTQINSIHNMTIFEITNSQKKKALLENLVFIFFGWFKMVILQLPVTHLLPAQELAR